MALKSVINGELLAMLKRAKEGLQATLEDSEFFPFGEGELFSFSLKRTGVKLYPYVMRSGDITLMMSTRKVDSQIPNMALRIGSLTSQADLMDTMRTLKMWLKHYGVYIKEEKVSRIDICADITTNINNLNIIDQRRMITRAHYFAGFWNRRKLTGCQVGKGDIVMRIYDKIAELKYSRDDHKADFFQKKWGQQNVVTRVEFQLRREAIASFFRQDTSLRRVIMRIPHMWDYLTGHWFRQSSKRVDRENRNQGQARITEFWQLVQSAFKDVPKPAKRLRKQKHINIKDLISQASGSLLTILSATGIRHDNIPQMMGEAFNLIEEAIFKMTEEPNFYRKFYKRASEAIITF